MAESLQALLLDTDDLHRNVARERVLLEVIQYCPAEHVRKKNIQHDSKRPELMGKRAYVGSLRGDHALQSLLAYHAEQYLSKVRVVFDDQHYGVPRSHTFAVIGYWLRLDCLMHDQRRRAKRGLRGKSLARPVIL